MSFKKFLLFEAKFLVKYLSLLIIIILIYNFVFTPWTIIAIQNAYEKPYIANEHDCDDISFELIKKLNDLGYTARIQYSQDALNGNCYEIDVNYFCHAWVVLELNEQEIHIESTSGLIIPKDYYTN